MKIAIIGAGFAGLSSVKVLRELGFDVVAYEKAPDVGGVWSATRRYPGVSTQNNKGTYALSDHPMPKHYPEWPSGAQVQEYLEAYVDKFGLAPYLRLSTEVTETVPTADGWTVRATGPDGETSEDVDHLVVANGIFSEPLIPPFDGVAEFEAAGGSLLASSDFHDVEDARGKNVVVVGYGKSACDVTIPISEVAASTTVIARELLWKMPKKVKGVLNYKYLMLTRLGEGLFPYKEKRGAEKLLHAGDSKLANNMLGTVEGITVKQLKLKTLGLVPDGTFSDIARSTVSLTTDGFYEKVADGEITVERDMTVVRLLEKDGRPHAELADGRVVPADVVVCATGFQQVVPFFSGEIQDQLTDDRGNYQLYRQIHPLRVPNLSFCGYNSSFFSPLSAEMAAVWIGSKLLDQHQLPSVEEMERIVNDRLAWMEERTEGRHARGTNIIPFSMHNVDEMLDEIGLNVSKLTKAKQWLLPTNPRSYAGVTKRLKARAAGGRP